MKRIVEDWAWLVGAAPLPPLWSLGYQQSRYSYYPESEVRRIAGTLRSERIPSDVIWLDIDFQLKNRPFTVDPERFPHFEQMIRDLKAQHLKTVLITDMHLADLPNAGYRLRTTKCGSRAIIIVKNPDATIDVCRGRVAGQGRLPRFHAEGRTRVVGDALCGFCRQRRGGIFGTT